MAEHLVWSVNVRAADGPRVMASGELDVDTYDKHSVTIEAGKSQKVELGPLTAGSIRCLIIVPTPAGDELTYTVGTTEVLLDEPQFLFGGAVTLAGNPTDLTFKNNSAADVEIDILVGRDATP